MVGIQQGRNHRSQWLTLFVDYGCMQGRQHVHPQNEIKQSPKMLCMCSICTSKNNKNRQNILIYEVAVINLSYIINHSRTKHDLPFGLCTLLTDTIFSSLMTSLHHSYHTLPSSHFLQILHLTLDPEGASWGSLRGKYSGNQLNIPTEKVVGAILMMDDSSSVPTTLW